MPKRIFALACILPVVLAGLSGCRASSPDAGAELERGFKTPPPSARPWVYWFWCSGNVTREGITADLEAMKRAGIGGLLMFEVAQGTPEGPVLYASPEWRDLFKFACAEAERLGLEVSVHNSAGWSGSGGPWITPDLAAQKLVWTETEVRGPGRFDGALPEPEKKVDYYRDVRVLAFPTPSGNARIDNLPFKSVGQTTDFHYMGRASLLPTRAVWPEPAAGEVVAPDRILDLTDRLEANGRLAWDVPDGAWTVLRLGHTPSGTITLPAPPSGGGLDCDKLNPAGIEAHFNGLVGRLAAEAGPRAGRTMVGVHVDSWETGAQNWTANFPAEFLRLRGYDLRPYLPVMTGRIVESRAVSERFLWDLRQTISELLIENYAGRFRELAAASGLRLSIEGYTTVPADELAYGGRADEPVGEFWTWWFRSSLPYGFGFTCTEMASSAHVYGKRIVGVEGFTATDAERWRSHPASIKEIGDWAFCEGINRFIVHRYAMQPWRNARPGMSMGDWGLHYERTQPWWEMSGAWHEYLSRCQYMLRQGLFAADVCYLGAEGAPQSIGVQKRFFARGSDNPDEPRDRTGYNFDLCPPDALLTRVSVKDGRLVLPDGMSYRLLALPRLETMTPRLLAKVKELLEAGATVVGSRPFNSPSLAGYPGCDGEVARLTKEIWGDGEPPAVLTERRVGKGRLFWSVDIQKSAASTPSPREVFGPARWIWYPEGDPAVAVPPGRRYFRRIIVPEAGRPLASVRLTMRAEDAFECWLNGRKAGEGHNFHRIEDVDLTPLMTTGPNLLAFEAVNRGEAPNPASIIGRISIRYADGGAEEIFTDASWETAMTVPENWRQQPADRTGWKAARDVGPFGMAPWGEVAPTFREIEVFLEEEAIAGVFGKLGIPPDFDFLPASGVRSLRYTHRAIDGADLYFVANKLAKSETAVCAFRIRGMRPEIWRPDTGAIELPAIYEERDGITRLPVSFEPSGSVFIVFRGKAAGGAGRLLAVERDGAEVLSAAWNPGAAFLREDPGVALSAGRDGGLEILAGRGGAITLKYAGGKSKRIEVPGIAAPMEIPGPWEVRFDEGEGAPGKAVFESLVSWSDRPEPGIKYYSGCATYTTTFAVPDGRIGSGTRHALDLGDVQVMADVRLNGRELGVLWKPPYRVDVTGALKTGPNVLEVRVASLIINRQIGDEQLPEDSDRNPDGTLKSWPDWLMKGLPSPVGRRTFTSWRLWKEGDPLVPSGLLGPVRMITLVAPEI